METELNGVTWSNIFEVLLSNLLSTVANNVIIGGMWVDHYGTIEFKNTGNFALKKKFILKVSGEKCVMKFTKAGWLGAGRWQTTGDIFGKDGKLKYILVAYFLTFIFTE